MSVPGVAQAERLALCDLLDKLGPEAPTLCEGWATRDLAAHLVARDTRPDAVPGLLIPGLLASWTQRLERRTRDTVGYDDLVGRLRTGPPLLGPFGLPYLRETANIHEYYVHHEDVRRPNGGGPRNLAPELSDALWRRLRLLSPFLLRRLRGVGVTLERTDRGGDEIAALGGDSAVRLTGTAGELFLYLFNRRRPAAVAVDGSSAAVATLNGTRLGL